MSEPVDEAPPSPPPRRGRDFISPTVRQVGSSNSARPLTVFSVPHSNRVTPFGADTPRGDLPEMVPESTTDDELPLNSEREAAPQPAEGDSDDVAALKKRVAELILQRQTDRSVMLEQKETIEVLRRRIAVVDVLLNQGFQNSPPLSATPLSRSPIKKDSHETTSPRGSSAPASKHPGMIRRTSSDLGGSPSIGIASTARVELEKLQRRNEQLVETTEELGKAAVALEAQLQIDLAKANETISTLQNRIIALEQTNEELKGRIADYVVLKSTRNRIEIAAKRISAPRVARTSGLARLEAAERNALEAHDDMYYIQRFDALKAPVRDVTLVMQSFSGADALRKQSPEMAGYVFSVYHSTVAAIAIKKNGYRVSHWDNFSCYAFTSPVQALQFASACHLSLLNFSWPDPVVYCAPFKQETVITAPPKEAVPAIATSRGGAASHVRTPSTVVSAPSSSAVIFNGPRLSSLLHHCTPNTEVNPRDGRITYFGRHINEAIAILSYLVRPGEVCANESWGRALLAEVIPEPEAILPNVADYLHKQGYDCEERGTASLPPIPLVTISEPVKKTAYATAQIPPPQQFQPTFLFSVLPSPLKKRRSLIKDEKLASTDSTMAFVLMANRAINGRANNRESVDAEMGRWLQQLICTSPAAVGLCGGGVTAKRQRKSAVPTSPMTQPLPGASPTTPAESAAAAAVPSQQQQGRGSVAGEIRRQSRSSSVATGAQLKERENSAMNNLLGGTTFMPFELPPTGNTEVFSGQTSRHFLMAKMFQKSAQAHEQNLMSLEDRYLVTRRAPLSIDSPPCSYCAVDVANVKKFDGYLPELFDRFIPSFRKMVVEAAELHHGHLIADNNEDVFLYAFRETSDAFRFAAMLHIRFRSEELLSALSPEGFSLAAASASRLQPNAVHLRCGISGGSPQSVEPVFDQGVLQRTRCTGYCVAQSGYLCASALPGEIIVSQRAMKDFLSVRKNMVSLDYTIINRGYRVYSGGPMYSACVFSMLPSKLGLGGRAPGPLALKPAARAGSVAYRSLSMSPGVASQSGGFPDDRLLLGVGTPTGTGNSVEHVTSVDFDKIANTVSERRRNLKRFVRQSTVNQDVLRIAMAARERMELMEQSIMATFDPLSAQELSVVPEPNKPLAALYIDVEGSAKLLEAVQDSFVRSQQHYNAVVVDSIRLFDGYTVKCNGFEAFIAVFRNVKSALGAALYIQQQLLASDWPTELIKNERALRVRDAKTGLLLFSGLRARIGIANGNLTASVVTTPGAVGRLDYSGAPISEAVKLGRSANGGDIWLTHDAVHEVEQADSDDSKALVFHSSILSQCTTRPVCDSKGDPVAISCVLNSMQGRIAKFSSVDRLSKIVAVLEKDVGIWWKAPNACSVKYEAVRFLAKKKSIAGFADSKGLFFGVNGAQGPGGIAGSVVPPLLERLLWLEPGLSAASIAAAAPAARDVKEASTRPSNSTSSHSPNKGVQAAAGSDAAIMPPLTVTSLSSVLRGTISLLQAVTSGNTVALEPAMKTVEDVCRSVAGIRRSSPESTPPSVAPLKPVAPPPGKKAASASGRPPVAVVSKNRK